MTNEPPTSDPHPSDPSAAAEPVSRRDPLRALLEEWFVTYNPLPLASAALVLGGLWIASWEVASRGMLGALGVSAIAELYALALIAGAWALHAHGHRRSAVMLGLLAALYQCDVTLHLERCAYLGGAGLAAALAWLALFAIKLRLIARALELEPSRAALFVPTLGAACVALLPQLYPHFSPHGRGVLAGLAVFVVGAAALSTSRDVRCAVGFDVRGRRSMRGVQVLLAVAALAHLGYACAELHVPVTPLLLALAFAALRVVRREAVVWLVTIGLLALVARLAAPWVPFAALLGAASLALHALRQRAPHVEPPAAPAGPSYRGAPLEELAGSEVTALAARPIAFANSSPDARVRLGSGALWLAHLAATGWTVSSLLAEHSLTLDVLLVALCLAAAARLRRTAPLAPLGLATMHLAIVERVLVWPRDPLEGSVWAIALGFALLGASIALSVRVAPGHRRAMLSR